MQKSTWLAVTRRRGIFPFAPRPHQTPGFESWFGQRTIPRSLLCLLTPHNSTLIAVLNLISKWAHWLEKPDNGECNLSGHKHWCVHISEHRCTPGEVEVQHAWLAFDFTHVITVSFVPMAAFWGGSDLNFLLPFVGRHTSNIKRPHRTERVHLSAQTLSFLCTDIILMNRKGHFTLIRIPFYCQSCYHKLKDELLEIMWCQCYLYLLHADQYCGQFPCACGECRGRV